MRWNERPFEWWLREDSNLHDLAATRTKTRIYRRQTTARMTPSRDTATMQAPLRVFKKFSIFGSAPVNARPHLFAFKVARR